MSPRPELTIHHEHVNLVTVEGRLDRAGVQDLQRQFDLLLDRGARFVVADLSHAVPNDSRLAAMMARTADLLRCRGGWLRLVGPGESFSAPGLDAPRASGTRPPAYS